MSSKTVWTWNVLYQVLYDKMKSLIKDDVCMKFYNETKPLYLETDASGIGLGTCPKDTAPDNTMVRPIAFGSKSLTSTEWRYSNIEREALGILQGLERFHCYCFAREVNIITDHKPIVAIFKKMWLDCLKEYNTFSSGYTNSGSGYYTSLGQSFSMQIGCPDIITQRTKMQRYTA